MPEIRNATEKDIPNLLPLLEQLGYPQNTILFQNHFRKFIALPGYDVVVATQDNKIVGLIAWSKSLCFVAEKARIHLEGLVVDPQYRKKGIGRTLMKYLEEFSKQFSPCIIDLTSGLRREKEGSHEFYKSLGYKNEGPMAKLYLRKEV